VIGQNITCIGYNAQPSSNSASNEITLGDANISVLRCNATSITSLSDERFKDNMLVLDKTKCLKFINKLNPITFTWKPEEIKINKYGPNDEISTEVYNRLAGNEIGFTAQDLQSALSTESLTVPGLVIDTNPSRLEATYGKLIPVLVASIKELTSKIDALQSEVSNLKTIP
jgi:hypothetical protein